MIYVLSVWQVVGVKQFTLCAGLAICLSILAVQSTNQERVCKAHDVIHTKTRNRLVNKLVQMLLFCYINFLLSRKDNSIVAKFLVSAINDELDEGGLDNRELDSREEEDAEDK
jgi:hypothetical protein